MNVVVLDDAEADLAEGREFYELQQSGIGDYFSTSLTSDLESLRLYAGTHSQVFGFHRALARRFPFGIYDLIEDDVAHVFAVLDLRRDPAWIRRRLGGA